LNTNTPDPDSIGHLARKGIQWTLILIVARQVLSLGSTFVIARLLIPEDYGAVALVTTILGVLYLVANIGLPWTIVQSDKLNQPTLNTLFIFTGTIGFLAWILCCISGYSLAFFYNSPKLTSIAVALGSCLVFRNLSIVPLALIRRQVRQDLLTIIQTTGLVLSISIAIGIAWLGGHYWALVAQQITNELIGFTLALRYSTFRLAHPASIKSLFPFLHFGGHLGITNILNSIQRSTPQLVLGFFGSEYAGLFNRAAWLKDMPYTYTALSLNDVMIPSLLAFRNQPIRLENAYHKALRGVASIGCLFAVWLGATATQTIPILLGPKWLPAAEILTILTPAGVMLPIYGTLTWLYIATGRSKEMLIRSFIMMATIITACLVSIPMGAKAVVTVVSLTSAFPISWAAIFLAHKTANISFSKTFKALLPILVSSAFAFFAGGLVDYLNAKIDWSIAYLLIAKTAAVVLSYLMLLSLLDRNLIKIYFQEISKYLQRRTS
jgi:O-antigen/teichoic acid export membrane protein